MNAYASVSIHLNEFLAMSSLSFIVHKIDNFCTHTQKKCATLKHEIKRSSFQSRNEIIQWEIKVFPWHCGLWCWFLFSRTQFIWNAHCSYRSCGQNWMRHSVTVDIDATRIFVSFSISTRFSLSTATRHSVPL